MQNNLQFGTCHMKHSLCILWPHRCCPLWTCVTESVCLNYRRIFCMLCMSPVPAAFPYDPPTHHHFTCKLSAPCLTSWQFLCTLFLALCSFPAVFTVTVVLRCSLTNVMSLSLSLSPSHTPFYLPFPHLSCTIFLFVIISRNWCYFYFMHILSRSIILLLTPLLCLCTRVFPFCLYLYIYLISSSRLTH